MIFQLRSVGGRRRLTNNASPYEAVLDVTPVFPANLTVLFSADDVLAEAKS
jgi:hypothetical protein